MDLNSVNITATQVAKNYFSAYVENGFIYSYSVYGERQQVGVTNDAYTALQKTALCNLPKCTVGVTPVLNNPTTSTPTVSSKD